MVDRPEATTQSLSDVTDRSVGAKRPPTWRDETAHIVRRNLASIGTDRFSVRTVDLGDAKNAAGAATHSFVETTHVL
jgi:hypothetical protein